MIPIFPNTGLSHLNRNNFIFHTHIGFHDIHVAAIFYLYFRSYDSDCEAVANRPGNDDNEDDDEDTVDNGISHSNSDNVSASGSVDIHFNEAQPGSSSSYSSNSQRGNVSGSFQVKILVQLMAIRCLRLGTHVNIIMNPLHFVNTGCYTELCRLGFP